MGKEADIVKLGASVVRDGVPLVQAVIPVGDDVGDTEGFGEIPMFQALGVSSVPYQADDDSHAEGVGLRNCGNYDMVCVGGRDVRTSKIIGNMKPGDTVLHSTGPSLAAQVQCKEEKRQVVLATKDKSGKDHALILDGGNKKFQVAMAGAMIEIDQAGNISLVAKGGKASILIQGDSIYLLGKVTLGGGTPFAPILAGAPPGTPVPGVFVGR